MLEKFIALIIRWIDLAIYCWGGQGEATSEADIRAHETSVKNADRAIALFRARVAAGVSPVIKFDCSGLIVWALQLLGLFPKDADMSANGLYNKSPKIAKTSLRIGDLCFRIDAEGDAFHVGVVTHIKQGVRYITEAEGRDKGVIKRPIDAVPGYWESYGRNPYFDTSVYDPVNLVEGARSPRAKALQEALNARGFDCGTPDGIFGPKTDTAVEAFQAAAGLTVDGIAGPKTMAALGFFSAELPAPDVEGGTTEPPPVVVEPVVDPRIAEIEQELAQKTAEVFALKAQLEGFANRLDVLSAELIGTQGMAARYHKDLTNLAIAENTRINILGQY